MHNKSFCIFNRQFTEAEYKEEVKKYRIWPAKKVLDEVEKIRKSLPVTQTHEANNENSSYGDYVYYNKNCYMCFDASYNKDSGYLYDTNRHTTCFDVTYSTENELSCQIVDSTKCFNSNFVVFSKGCVDSSYIINGYDIKNCLGSVNRSHAEYEILNRKYSPEEYERISREILEDIQRKKIDWGDINFH
jgi:hypothetical protein